MIVIVWGALGFKTRDKVFDVGPLHATKETTHSVPYAPIAGAIVVAGGAILLATARE
jgi:hypothetical protein